MRCGGTSSTSRIRFAAQPFEAARQLLVVRGPRCELELATAMEVTFDAPPRARCAPPCPPRRRTRGTRQPHARRPRAPRPWRSPPPGHCSRDHRCARTPRPRPSPPPAPPHARRAWPASGAERPVKPAADHHHVRLARQPSLRPLKAGVVSVQNDSSFIMGTLKQPAATDVARSRMLGWQMLRFCRRPSAGCAAPVRRCRR